MLFFESAKLPNDHSHRLNLNTKKFLPKQEGNSSQSQNHPSLRLCASVWDFSVSRCWYSFRYVGVGVVVQVSDIKRVSSVCPCEMQWPPYRIIGHSNLDVWKLHQYKLQSCSWGAFSKNWFKNSKQFVSCQSKKMTENNWIFCGFFCAKCQSMK